MVKEKIVKFKNTVWNKIKGGARRVKIGVCFAGRKVGGFFKCIGCSIGRFFKNIGCGIARFAKGAFKGCVSFFKKCGLWIVSIPKGIEFFAVKVKNIFLKMASSVKSAFLNKKITTFLKNTAGDFMCFAKKHKKWFFGGAVVVYTGVIIVGTLTVENIVDRTSLPAFNEQQTVDETNEPAHETRVVMEQGEDYEVSENCTIRYEGVDFNKTITPTNAEKFGSYYENESQSNTYMDIKITYTNTSSETIRGDRAVKMTVMCDDAMYNCFTAIEKDEGTNIENSSLVEIPSGESALIHCIFDVPLDTRNAGKISADAVADNKSYIINIK